MEPKNAKNIIYVSQKEEVFRPHKPTAEERLLAAIYYGVRLCDKCAMPLSIQGEAHLCQEPKE